MDIPHLGLACGRPEHVGAISGLTGPQQKRNVVGQILRGSTYIPYRSS
jgi:hypothetical protein